MDRITVFCGSSSGTDDVFITTATALGKKLATCNIGLVYGGAKIGLMGAVANGAMEEGGTVIGVIPDFLKTKEVAHDAITELIVVDTMHERKTRMNELCDAVIALPGGFGTMEEVFEMLTWAQLGLHAKPIGVLNTEGYYDALIGLVDTMVDKGFLKDLHRDMLIVSNDIDDLLDKMSAHKVVTGEKWVN